MTYHFAPNSAHVVDIKDETGKIVLQATAQGIVELDKKKNDYYIAMLEAEKRVKKLEEKIKKFMAVLTDEVLK